LFGVLLREPASFHDVQVSQHDIVTLLAPQLTADWMPCSRISFLGTLAGLLAAVVSWCYCLMHLNMQCRCLLRTAGAWAADQQADK
jgi:hypothetical protein